jgi:hypothetical protein
MRRLKSISLDAKYSCRERQLRPIRGWIEACNDYHKQDLTKAALTSHRKVYDILLIDVIENWIISCAVQSTTCVALSYVCEPNGLIYATQATREQLVQRDSLSGLELPLVIKDAIEFIKNFKELYL